LLRTKVSPNGVRLKYIPINVLLSMAQNNFVEVAKVSEIPDGKMKHVEVEGKEALIANVGGKFYAISAFDGQFNRKHSNMSFSWFKV
jgi:hypothetical protein